MTGISRWLGLTVIGAVAALGCCVGYSLARGETVLKVIPQADLRSLDPVWATSSITQIHGYMVYDTLFGLDSKLQPQPQMVDKYAVSPDGLSYTFTLRQGLKWQDGTPVIARDAVASIKRWGARAVGGQVLMPRIGDLVAIDDLTFKMTLKQPFGPLLEVLADPVVPLFVMREQDALTDPFKQITESIGSGPFIFAKDQFQPGNRVVYLKNPDYQPRREAADGLAGGKVVKVDKVVWTVIPDNGVAVAALGAGEEDIMEIPPFDLLPVLQRNKDVKLVITDPNGYQPMIRPNQLIPPFNNPKARLALLYLVDEKEYLAAMVGDPKYEVPCLSPFICGSPNESNVGLGEFGKPNLAKAKQLFDEAGYKGEPIVIMDPTDQQIIHGMTLVTADNLRKIGVNVDLQAMDWSTLVSRRPIKDPPNKDPRGWHIFQTTWPSLAMANPLTNSAVASPCDGKNWFGWSCDEELEKRRLAYLNAKTSQEKRGAIDSLQERFFQVVPIVPLGQFTRPVATRSNISGLLNAPYLVVWNVEKN